MSLFILFLVLIVAAAFVTLLIFYLKHTKSLEETNHDLNARNVAMQNSNQSLARENHDLRSRCKQIEEWRAGLQKANQSLETSCLELKERNESLSRENAVMRTRYSKVVDIDFAADAARAELAKLTESLKRTLDEAAVVERRQAELSQQISLLEENLEDVSYGFYKPHFAYDSSERYKTAIERVRERQKVLIRNGEAAQCRIQWSIGNDRKEGERMSKQYLKALLRAFNGECDAAVAKVSWNNIAKMEERVAKAFRDINQMGEVMQMSISHAFLDLKLEELRLTFEHEEKKYQEREEQRQIREQMRDEERAQREMERARLEAEREEERYRKALEKARVEQRQAVGQKVDILTERVRLLEAQLAEAENRTQRAISQAQLTKSGYVYVISNIGSFGEQVYKIGMTRRLDPMDRVIELGDASVPFPFDVHAMIYTENAPALESALHSNFHERRVKLNDLFWSGALKLSLRRSLRRKSTGKAFH